MTRVDAAVRTDLPMRNPAEELNQPEFNAVFRQYCRFVWRVLAKVGIFASDLPDACQDVFLVVHRRLATFDSSRASLPSWLFGICSKVASDYRRRRWSKMELGDSALPEPSVEPSQHEELEILRARAQLSSALAEMNEPKRTVFLLYEFEELSMEEVALAVGCPVQTAYSRLHAARREVIEAFAKFESKGGANETGSR